VNYLALLGWSWGEQDFFTTDELVRRFDIARVSRNPRCSDTQKLEWMNNHYIQGLGDDELAARCLHFLTAAGLSPEPVLLRRAMPLVKERMKTLTDSVELLWFLFTDDVAPNEKATQVMAKAPAGYVRAAATALEAVEPWTAEAIGEALDVLAEGAGLNRTKGWQPVRAAVTGRPSRRRCPSRSEPGPRADDRQAAGRVNARSSPGRSPHSWRSRSRPRPPARAGTGPGRHQAPGRLEEDPVRRQAQATDGRVLGTALRGADVGADRPASDRAALHGRDLLRPCLEPLRLQRQAPGRETGVCARSDRHR
jgi:hypothetical protein